MSSPYQAVEGESDRTLRRDKTAEVFFACGHPADVLIRPVGGNVAAAIKAESAQPCPTCRREAGTAAGVEQFRALSPEERAAQVARLYDE